MASEEPDVKLADTLSHEEVIKNTWMAAYLCCLGSGLGIMDNPLLGYNGKLCCFRARVASVDVIDKKDGIFQLAGSFLCITMHGQFPPKAWTPRCICCNRKFWAGEDKFPPSVGMFDNKMIIEETFWLFYILCLGIGVNRPGAGGRPYLGGSQKLFCVKGQAGLEPVVKDSVLCELTGTMCCFWAQAEFPPQAGNPGIALLGLRMRMPPSEGQEQAERPLTTTIEMTQSEFSSAFGTIESQLANTIKAA